MYVKERCWRIIMTRPSKLSICYKWSIAAKFDGFRSKSQIIIVKTYTILTRVFHVAASL